MRISAASGAVSSARSQRSGHTTRPDVPVRPVSPTPTVNPTPEDGTGPSGNTTWAAVRTSRPVISRSDPTRVRPSARTVRISTTWSGGTGPAAPVPDPMTVVGILVVGDQRRAARRRIDRLQADGEPAGGGRGAFTGRADRHHPDPHPALRLTTRADLHVQVQLHRLDREPDRGTGPGGHRRGQLRPHRGDRVRQPHPRLVQHHDPPIGSTYRMVPTVTGTCQKPVGNPHLTRHPTFDPRPLNPQAWADHTKDQVIDLHARGAISPPEPPTAATGMLARGGSPPPRARLYGSKAWCADVDVIHAATGVPDGLHARRR